MTQSTAAETESEQQNDADKTVQTRLKDFIEEQTVCTDGGQPIDGQANGDANTRGNINGTNSTSASEPTSETDSQSSNTSATNSHTPPETITPNVKKFIYCDRKNKCELCGADGGNDDVNLNIHHRQHQANGGTNHPENILLICEQCHNRHHGTTPAPRQPAEGVVNDQAQTLDATEHTDAPDPLPPRSKPNRNGTDSDILAVVEKQGPVRTSDIAAQVDHTKQTVRRICWKLSGEQLIARTTDREWALQEQVGADEIVIGLPDNPKKAKRAGRDEVIRQMSAHNIPHTEIAEITGLTRQTVSVAVDRARALRIDSTDPVDVDTSTIAQRLMALVDLLDYVNRQGTDN